MSDTAGDNAAYKSAWQTYQLLLSQVRSLILATINAEGTPLSSYAPFIVTEQRQFYIFTSRLAAHTANLQRTGQAGIMLIEDEGASGQLFARKRVTFDCQVRPVPRESDVGKAALAEYEARFGQIMRLLKSLPDFQLFELQPYSGALVTGFGQAYKLSGERFETITPLERDG